MSKIEIVVADDDEDVVTTLTTLLDEKGISVVGKAYDGEEATALYFTFKPDVILLDLNMPNYDGHYAIEKIKQKDPSAKIIVISAYLDKLFDSNIVSAVFSKPYDIDAIVKKIKELANTK